MGDLSVLATLAVFVLFALIGLLLALALAFSLALRNRDPAMWEEWGRPDVFHGPSGGVLRILCQPRLVPRSCSTDPFLRLLFRLSRVVILSISLLFFLSIALSALARRT